MKSFCSRMEDVILNLLRGIDWQFNIICCKPNLTRKFQPLILNLEVFMRKFQERFVVDDHGAPKAVLIPFDKYEQLMEGIHDLAVIAFYEPISVRLSKVDSNGTLPSNQDRQLSGLL